MKHKFSLKLPHGNVDGIYLKSQTENSPLVIITNGHDGFYNYGMFPYIQEELQNNGISSISYNFSHGGISGDNDYFTELDLYKKNSMRLETEDLKGLISKLGDIGIQYEKGENKLILLSHSLGDVPVVFATKELKEQGYTIDGIIFLAPTMTLDFWSKEQMEEWEKNGVLIYKNKRTEQYLPQGKEFLEETKQAHNKWSIEKALKHTKSKFLIFHGDKDDSVPFQESEAIHKWNEKNNNSSELVVVKNANHLFNTKHPFNGTTPELDFTLKTIVDWVNKL